MRRALVVAHPDDEALWFGGLLIAEPGDWTIICCSIPRTDPIRAWKFFDACDVLGAKGKLLPFTEAEPSAPLGHLERLDLAPFDQIVTHGIVGEYGHAHHVAVNRYIAARWPEKMWAGCYGKADGVRRIEMSGELYARKVQALRCYDHTSPSDGKEKWRALIARYGTQFDLSVETYERCR